jgi:hypothetical protein
MKNVITKTIMAACLVGSSIGFSQTTQQDVLDAQKNNKDVLTDSVPRGNSYSWLRRKNVINVNLSSMIISHYGISYERVLTNKISVRLYGDVASYSVKYNNNDVQLNGFGIVPEFRYYVSGMGAPYGYFIGLYGVIRSYNLKGSFDSDGKHYTGDGSSKYFGFGFVNGPQFVIGNRVVIAIPFGISFGGGTTTNNFVYTDTNNGNTETKNANIPFIGGSFIMPRFGIELGIAF